MTTNLAANSVQLAKIVEGSEGSGRAVAIVIGCIVTLAGLLLLTNFKNVTVRYRSLGGPLQQARGARKRWLPNVVGWRVIGALWIITGLTMALGGIFHSPNSG